MKALNELIQVLARFNTSGDVEPVAFKHGQKEHRIKAIQSWHFGKSIWANNCNRIYQVCTEDGRIAELEWIIDTGEWKLLKL
jgi:hypothetical protein